MYIVSRWILVDDEKKFVQDFGFFSDRAGAEIKLKELQKTFKQAHFQFEVREETTMNDDERTDAEILADVSNALEDRQDAGLSAENYVEVIAPKTLDGVSQSDKKLIQKAV